VAECELAGENCSSLRKSSPVQSYAPQIPHYLTWHFFFLFSLRPLPESMRLILPRTPYCIVGFSGCVLCIKFSSVCTGPLGFWRDLVTLRDSWYLVTGVRNRSVSSASLLTFCGNHVALQVLLASSSVPLAQPLGHCKFTFLRFLILAAFTHRQCETWSFSQGRNVRGC
jgi:hypothetical protein